MFRLKHYWRMLVTQLFWRPWLGALGARSALFRPMMVVGAGGIRIGSRTVIKDFARLQVIHHPKLG